MRVLWLVPALFALPATGHAQSMLACTFPTLPQVVFSYPGNETGPFTMRVGARPPVPLAHMGTGTEPSETADLDGYHFVFDTVTLRLEVQQAGKTLITEVGRCASTGEPDDATPLTFVADSAADTPVQDKGKWQVSEDKSQLDDSATVILTINSEGTIAGQFGPAGPAELIIRCKENATSAFMVLNDLFLADVQGFGTVDFRIDAKKADKARMEASTDNKALGLWSGGSAIPFAKKLMAGDKVVFRATPFNESPVEFEFDLRGLTAAIDPLRKACKW